MRKCQNCKTVHSKKEKKCPSCGYSIKNFQRFIILWGAVCIIAYVIIWDSSTKSPDISSKHSVEKVGKSWQDQNNSSMAFIKMKGFVKSRLKSPGSSKFPWSAHTKYIGNQRYRVISYVDSQNSFGAFVRTNFVGEIEQTSKNYWTLLSLSI